MFAVACCSRRNSKRISEKAVKIVYSVNDTILYGSHGVCRITGIEEKNFSGNLVKYYVLCPVYSENSTIYVPVDNEKLAGKMRRVLTPEEIYQIIRVMPQEESFWIEEENERKEKYKEILARGDRLELVKMIKALYYHQQEQHAKGRRLHTADEHFFREAEKLLYDEFALVLHIKPEQVLPFIMEQVEIQEKERECDAQQSE